MPTDFVAQLPAIAAIIEKAGVIGTLLIAVGWLVYERLQLVKRVVRMTKQRDKCRLICERYRASLVAAGGIIPDIADITQLYSEAEEDA